MDNQIKPEEHLGLVAIVASRFVPKNIPIQDSEEFSDGILGLLRAAEKFDPNNGVEFSTYAFRVIQRAIMLGWRKKNRKRQITANVSLNDPTLEKLIPAREQTNFHKVMETVLAEHPDDTPQDKFNKEMLVEHYLNGKTWQQIGDERGFTRAWAQQSAAKALKVIQQRFSLDDLGLGKL